jgi:hypothetical protein
MICPKCSRETPILLLVEMPSVDGKPLFLINVCRRCKIETLNAEAAMQEQQPGRIAVGIAVLVFAWFAIWATVLGSVVRLWHWIRFRKFCCYCTPNHRMSGSPIGWRVSHGICPEALAREKDKEAARQDHVARSMAAYFSRGEVAGRSTPAGLASRAHSDRRRGFSGSAGTSI